MGEHPSANDRSGARFDALLASCLERMVATAMDPTRWPSDWSEQDRREMAEREVLGRRS